MKYIVTILAFVTSVVLADGERQLLIGIPWAAWTNTATGDKAEIINALISKAGSDQVFCPVAWRQSSNPSKIWMIDSLWLDHITVGGRITSAQVQAIKDKLVNANIRLQLTDNSLQTLLALGLEPAP